MSRRDPHHTGRGPLPSQNGHRDLNAESIAPRDPHREATFYAKSHIPARFAKHVAARLDILQAIYGSSWADRPLVALLDEMRDVSAELLAWGLLALQHPVLNELDQDAADRVGHATTVAGIAALAAHNELDELLTEIESKLPRENQGDSRGT